MSPLDDVEDLLRESIGLDATTVGHAAVERAFQERMAAAGCIEPAAYVRRLRSDPSERDRLVEDVIVVESWFFRDRQVFEFVADFTVTLAALPGRVPVRILTAPCAAGEEPYSVAMALFDAGLPRERFTIDAIDVSSRALGRAARARYSANAFRNADLGFRDRWFRMDGGHALLDTRVQEAVRFERANLVAADFAAGRPRYDVIFCRNLLIYLAPDARRLVEHQIDRLLAADGILVLGAAEPPIMRGDWIPAGATSVFTLRRGVHAARSAVPEAVGRLTEPRLPAVPPSLPPAPAIGGTAPPPEIELEEVLAGADRLANAGRITEAIAWCERHRPVLPPAAQLFFLLGVLHQSAGDLDRAEAWFHKTLYLDAGHDEALLALALLARRRGDSRMEETYRQSAARVLARKEPPA